MDISKMKTEPKNKRAKLISIIGLFTKPEVINALGLIIAFLVFALDEGYLRQITISSQLHSIVHPQLSIQSANEFISLNACTVRNDGRANAEDVIIRIWSEPSISFFQGLPTVTGGEGLWEIEPAGGNANYARIHLPRLVATHALTVTARTDRPITFHCEVADANGPVEQEIRYPFSLQRWDFIVLLLAGFLFTVSGVFVIYQLLSRSRKHNVTNTANKSGEQVE